MKRLSVLLILGMFSFTAALAQNKAVAEFNSETNLTTIDTVTNATVKNQVVKISNGWTTTNVQVTATKISGTAAGVVRIFGSNDKVAWERLTATGTLAATDSLNLANVSTPQTKFFAVPGKYLWYRAAVTGSGTHTTQFRTTVVATR